MVAAETLFALDSRNRKDFQALFRGDRQQEYYRGDCWIEDRGAIAVKAERKAVGPASIVRLRANCTSYFRRTAGHIRQDGIDVAVLWFVKQGSLAYSDQHGEYVVEPGDYVLTRSITPFSMACRPASCGALDVLHLTLPGWLVEERVERALGGGLIIPDRPSELRIAENILTDLFEAGDSLLDQAPAMLVECVLVLASRALRATEPPAVRPQSILAERRLQQILRFIDIHLGSPRLCTAMLAQGCGISLRHLSTLLQKHGTSFTKLVWERRLSKAREWLAETDPYDISVSEISYALGFKSNAHFSRKFKKAFGVSPSQVRTTRSR